MPLPLTPGRSLTTWHLDVPVTVVVVLAVATYLLLARRVRDWPVTRTASFVGGALLVVVMRSSFLSTYDYVLMWPLAAEDVLLLTLIPLPLVVGRPGQLIRASLGKSASTRSIPPAVGSVVAVGTLIALYLSQWDVLRLEHQWFFRVTEVVLLVAGSAFLGPLLGDGSTGYGARTLVAFVDGLLDSFPGLAVLGSHGIAASYYAAHPRTWGPSVTSDRQIAGALMVALAELVGLPALIVLLVQWVRADAVTAAAVDARLDEELEADTDERPWWERDDGTVAERVRRTARKSD